MRRALATVGAAAIFLAACGSSSSGSSGDGASSSSSSSSGGSSSGGSSSGSSGTSGGTGPRRVFLNATLGPASAQTVCPVDGSSPYLAIGGSTAPIQDGASFNNAKVTVTCQVSSPNGTAYDVTADVTLAGVGEVKLSGKFVQGASTKVSATFTRQGTGPFTDDTCAVDYPTANHGVAGGRIWAHMQCGHASNADQSQLCLGNLELRLENCFQ